MVRKRLGTRSVGHAGTLDPFATGLLVVLVGRATRLARFIESAEKRYETDVRFGVATDTDDATGQVIRDVVPAEWPAIEALRDAARTLEGRQQQRPPAYSAKHVGGTRSYALARAGKAVELPPVEVMVYGLDVAAWTPPTARLVARVGRGTYIRAIARDLGERLQLPAHCATLRRTDIGPFAVTDAIAPDAIDAAALRAPAEMVRHLPRATVTPDEARELGFGRSIAQGDAAEGHGALLADDGRLLAIAEGREGRWHPTVVLEPAA